MLKPPILTDQKYYIYLEKGPKTLQESQIRTKVTRELFRTKIEKNPVYTRTKAVIYSFFFVNKRSSILTKGTYRVESKHYIKNSFHS